MQMTTTFCIRGKEKMCREQVLKEIDRILGEADDATVENCYWFLMMELEG